MGGEGERLAMHGEDYKLSEALKKVALKSILVGNINYNFELWESDYMPFEEILRRVRDQAQANKFNKSEKEAHTCRANISSGASQANGHRPGQEFDTWGEPAGTQLKGGSDPQEFNIIRTRQGKYGKAKCKGNNGKGKGT